MRENESWGRRTFLKATGAAGTAAAFGGVASASGSEEPTELVVGVSVPEKVRALADRLPPKVTAVTHDVDLGFVLARIEDADFADVETIRSRIEALDLVEYVEENVTYEAFETPNDPKFSDQYAPQQVNAPDAWETTQGSDDVTVAVVDQGVKYDHPDLKDRFGSDKGKDFVDDDDDPYPDNIGDEYHGTHVAGIASASTDNTKGIAGISDSHLLSVRGLSEEGSGSLSDIAQGVRWAADQGADVINMSLGGGGYTETMKNAVSYATNEGALVVCAAGNDGADSVSYPAAYDECIAVSALDDGENLADFSNTGDAIDLAAPGVDVLSCWTGSWFQDYKRISGTSMACPVVSGVAALVKAADPDATPEQVRSRLKDNAADVGLSEAEQGAGRVDAAAALSGSGNCGSAHEHTERSGSLSAGNGDTYGYGQRTDPACRISASLSGSANADFDLYVTLDGRTPTRNDYDRKSTGPGSEERIDLESDLDASTQLGILVYCYQGGGEYTLTVDEFGEVDNAAPTAAASASTTDADEGDQVVFDAGDSTDPDGSIASYEWDFGDGATATGESVTHRFGSGGTYEVQLTVTDDRGATATDTVTVDVDENWWPLW